MLPAMVVTEEAVMSLESTRALKSADAPVVAIRPERYMKAARRLRSETMSAGAGSVVARTAEAVRNLVALQPVPLRRSRPV